MLPFRSRSRSTASGDILDAVERETPLKPRRRALRRATLHSTLERLCVGAMCAASVSFCAFAVSTSLDDPDYFSRKLIASLQQADDVDPIVTGATAKPAAAAGAALPVPKVVRARPPEPTDYEIVMVFNDEAILATDDELMRVKVGSDVPGLGLVEKIVAAPDGGTVIAAEATLRSLPPR